MANQIYGHNSDFGFDFDLKEAIPLGGLSDNSSLHAFSRSNPLDAVGYADAQMGLKWQSCQLASLFSKFGLYIYFFKPN